MTFMDSQDYLTQAVSLARKGSLAEARDSCRRAIAENAAAAGAWVLLGDIDSRLGCLEEAEASYAKALDLNAIDPGVLQKFARLLLRMNNNDRAAYMYRKALHLRPGDPLLLFETGVLFQQMGHDREAEVLYRKSVTAKPDYVEALVNLAGMLSAQGRYDEALEGLSAALAARPGALFALIGMGAVYGRLLKPAKACEYFRSAVNIAPESLEANTGLATSLQALGKTKEASGIYQKILAIDPANQQALHMLAAYGKQPLPAVASPEYVSSLFDSYANNFDDHLVKTLGYRIPEEVCSLIEKWGAENEDEEKPDILDLGCGTGLCGRLLVGKYRSLVGVDLSEAMLDIARSLNIYTDLKRQDVSVYLQDNPGMFDVVIAADVFVYIGDLNETFGHCARAMCDRGLFIFSTEDCDMDDGYTLKVTGRYGHARSYIDRIAAAHGFDCLCRKDSIIRYEGGVPINGCVWCFIRI